MSIWDKRPKAGGANPSPARKEGMTMETPAVNIAVTQEIVAAATAIIDLVARIFVKDQSSPTVQKINGILSTIETVLENAGI
jgi:hypothetical protein